MQTSPDFHNLFASTFNKDGDKENKDGDKSKYIIRMVTRASTFNKDGDKSKYINKDGDKSGAVANGQQGKVLT